ncbi:MAG: SpoIIE family protein phosphatase, partial [Pseudomonadota bacterium]
FIMLPIPAGPAVGLIDAPVYVAERMMIEPGSMLFAFTDGLTDALNEAGEAYSDERLKQVVNSLDSPSVTTVVNTVLEDVRRFSGETEQFDDLTILAVCYRGGKGER